MLYSVQSLFYPMLKINYQSEFRSLITNVEYFGTCDITEIDEFEHDFY